MSSRGIPAQLKLLKTAVADHKEDLANHWKMLRDHRDRLQLLEMRATSLDFSMNSVLIALSRIEDQAARLVQDLAALRDELKGRTP